MVIFYKWINCSRRFGVANHFERRFKDIFPNLYNFLNKHALPDKTDDLNHINPTVYIRRALLSARFLLVFLTSVFYLAGPPQSALHIKISVVLAMLAAVILAQSLYNNKEMVDLLSHVYDPFKIVTLNSVRSCKSKKHCCFSCWVLRSPALSWSLCLPAASAVPLCGMH